MVTTLTSFQMEYVMDVWRELESTKHQLSPFEFQCELAWIRDCLQIFEHEMQEEGDAFRANYAQLCAWAQTQ